MINTADGPKSRNSRAGAHGLGSSFAGATIRRAIACFPSSPRQLLIFLSDVVLCALALVVAYFLRVGFDDLSAERVDALVRGIHIFGPRSPP
jgi:hypothetical protein